MPKEFPGASYDAWKTTNPADAELGPEPEEEGPISCDWCRRVFANPPQEHNIERLHGGAICFTCDTCLEELAEERPRR